MFVATKKLAQACCCLFGSAQCAQHPKPWWTGQREGEQPAVRGYSRNSLASLPGKDSGRHAFGERQKGNGESRDDKVNRHVPNKKVCWGKACSLVFSKRDGNRKVLEGGTGRRGWSRPVVGLVSPPCSCPKGPCASRLQCAAGPGQWEMRQW